MPPAGCALSEQQEQHRDPFNSNVRPSSEALAKLYQRLNFADRYGQRTPQTIGEEPLDYRNHLKWKLVNRVRRLVARNPRAINGEA